jgi:hypothetical protein
MFCVVDSKAENEPNVANPPFLKKKKQNLKFVRFFGVSWIQQIVITKLTNNNNCNNSSYKQCEGKNLMKLTFSKWGHPWQGIWHTKKTKIPYFHKTHY